MWQSLGTLNGLNMSILRQVFWKTKTFLVEFTKIENTILPYKTALSKPKLRQTKHGVQNGHMTEKHFHIFENLISVSESLVDNLFNVQSTQMSIIILFVSTWVLF